MKYIESQCCYRNTSHYIMDDILKDTIIPSQYIIDRQDDSIMMCKIASYGSCCSTRVR